MKIVRMELTPSDYAPTNVRWNADCDCVEITVDDGETWTADPGADPRSNPAYLLPPNTESDVKCASAGGMVAYVKQVVDAGIDGSTLTGLANALIGIALVFIPIAPLFALFFAIAEAILAIGSSALALNFTEGVYDDLLCIFFCNVDEDGRLDDAALEAVLEDVSAVISNFTVQTVMELLAQSVGAVGFSNAGAKLADGEADCSECDCGWCVYQDFRESAFDWTVYSGVGEYIPGVGFTSTDFGSDTALLIQSPMSRTTSIRRIVCCYESTQDTIIGAGYFDGSFHAFAAEFLGAEASPAMGTILPTTTTIAVDNLYINQDSGSGGGLFTLIGIWVYGDEGNDAPLDGDDCPPEECT